MKSLALAACAALFPVSALAHDGLSVTDGHARTTGRTAASAAAYMVIENHKSIDCRLAAVTGDAAERIELHTSSTDANGVVKMVKLSDGIAIPAGGEHALRRGADHVMMMGLIRPLVDGDSIALRFDFGECGTLDAEIPVDSGRAAGSTGDDGQDADHGAAH